MTKTNDVELLFNNFKTKLYKAHGDKYSVVSESSEYKTGVSILKFKCNVHNCEYEAKPRYVVKSPTGRCNLCEKEINFNSFVERATKVHGDKYTYEFEKYLGMHKPMQIGCNLHGHFLKAPIAHVDGQGCTFCSKVEESRLNFRNISSKIKDKHAGKYILVSSPDDYTDLRCFVTARCEKHGEYTAKAGGVLTSRTGLCQQCALDEEANNFITKAKEMHGDKYSYKPEDYKSSRDYMEILCNTHKTVFKQRPSAHLQGQGCPECGQISAILNMSKTQDEFIESLQKIYGNTYDYSRVNYTGAFNKVEIVCKKHGSFLIAANNALSKRANSLCIKCNKELNLTVRGKAFIEKSTELHAGKYDYSEVVYKGNKTRVKLRCKIHDHDFYTIPNKHMTSLAGCPICAKETMNRWTINAVMKNKQSFDRRNGSCYLFKISNASEAYYKVGFTSLTPKERCSQINAELTDYTCDVISSFSGTLTNAIKLEKVLHNIYKYKRYSNIPIDFGGKTELFALSQEDIEMVVSVFKNIDTHILDCIVSSQIGNEVIVKIKETYGK